MFDIAYTFHWHQALAALPAMLAGAGVSLQTAALTMALGVPIALLLTAARQLRLPGLAQLAEAWVSVARNTPALFQVYFLYFGLGSLDVQVSSWVALVAGVTFNNAGYLAENFRGCLAAVPEAQVRAARSLGLSLPRTAWHVVTPQLLRLAYPTLTNQLVWALLMTSLGVVVGLNNDLTGVTQDHNVRTFRTFEFFALAAVLYYAMTKTLLLGARLLAWRLFRY